ncbi:MAG: hypothetical protein EBU08_12420, partial [Micrococcales bacterium]|nr:hypothetical protein [Micrococcales bacterium]
VRVTAYSVENAFAGASAQQTLQTRNWENYRKFEVDEALAEVKELRLELPVNVDCLRDWLRFRTACFPPQRALSVRRMSCNASLPFEKVWASKVLPSPEKGVGCLVVDFE